MQTPRFYQSDRNSTSSRPDPAANPPATATTIDIQDRGNGPPWQQNNTTPRSATTTSTEKANIAQRRSSAPANLTHRYIHRHQPTFEWRSGWKIDSTFHSSLRATTVWAILSATVGTPKILVTDQVVVGGLA
jgi:hypothetical protein